MEKEVYQKLRKDTVGLRLDEQKASLNIIIFTTTLITGIVLSNFDSILFKIFGVLLMIIAMLQGQFIIHDLGHESYFKNKIINDLLGNVISLIPIIPYYPWKFIHAKHHLWSGYKTMDPTMSEQDITQIPEDKIKTINFCWKYWIPIFALSYSFTNFWNYKKYSKLFPDKINFFWFSAFFTILFYLFLFLTFPIFMFKIWLPTYLLFLAISEPLLFSQHVHIDQHDHLVGKNITVNPIPVFEQIEFSRTLLFPKIIHRYVMMGFNFHCAHHAFPDYPSFNLEKLPPLATRYVSGFKWIISSKRMKGSELLFKNSTQTDFNL